MKETLDKHIGNQLKCRRNSVGMSQGSLADCLGITFQQIQKYEKGINRISASTLYNISKILMVDIKYFFDGLTNPNTLMEDNKNEFFSNDIESKEIKIFLKHYVKIENKCTRKKIIDLIKSLSNTNNSTNFSY